MKSRPPLLGYNHNVRHAGRLFHVQTEDSGVQHARIFTHLFVGGTIVASKRADYGADDDEGAVQKRMQSQHKAVLKELRGGVYDEKIEALFGQLVTTLPPDATLAEAEAASAAAPVPEAVVAPIPAVEEQPLDTTQPMERLYVAEFEADPASEDEEDPTRITPAAELPVFPSALQTPAEVPPVAASPIELRLAPSADGDTAEVPVVVEMEATRPLHGLPPEPVAPVMPSVIVSPQMAIAELTPAPRVAAPPPVPPRTPPTPARPRDTRSASPAPPPVSRTAPPPLPRAVTGAPARPPAHTPVRPVVVPPPADPRRPSTLSYPLSHPPPAQSTPSPPQPGRRRPTTRPIPGYPASPSAEGVVARPAVVIRGDGASTPGARQPSQPRIRQPSEPRLAPVAAVGSRGTPQRLVPTPPRAIPAASRQSPEAVFGADLVSEKSLDEVILAYLAEDLYEE